MDHWGLALESSGNPTTSNTNTNSNNTTTTTTTSLNPFFPNYPSFSTKTTVEFQVMNSHRGEDIHDHHDHDHHDDGGGDGNGDDDDGMNDDKMVVGEVDFFSDHRNKSVIKSAAANNQDHHVMMMMMKDDDNSRDLNQTASSPPDHPTPTPHLDVNTRLHLLTTNTGSDQSTIDDGASSDAEDKRAKNELAVLQVELQRMNAENQKLKNLLSQVSQNYNALQMHLVTLMQQQKQLQKGDNTLDHEAIMQGKMDDKKTNIVPRQFLDLVGPASNSETAELTSSQPLLSDQHHRSHDNRSMGSPMEIASRNNNNNNGKDIVMYDNNGKGVVREESPEDSKTQGWVPNKVAKLNVPRVNSPVEQSAAEATMRKARVSVRARSEAPMISDGCQWRKYGQKMAKGNPCPRAYYRCTMAVGCPVRKQVQRCADDRSILITTYEGNHNHPLPPAAMAMASTTSAAASMLLSGSMPSGDGLMNPNFLARTILPCSSSMATISASAPFPTVTLDLTHSPNPLQQIQRPNAPQIPPNFLASMPHIFGQALLNNNNQSKFSGLHTTSSSQPIDPTQLQPPNNNNNNNNQNPGFADTLSAATAAIASDPNFTAALAAAISSIIGGGGSGAGRKNNNNNNNNVAGNSPSSGGATTSDNNNNNNDNVTTTSSSSMQQQ